MWPGLRTNSGVWFLEEGCIWDLLSLLLLAPSRRVFNILVITSIVFSSFSLEWHPLVQGGDVEGVPEGKGSYDSGRT